MNVYICNQCGTGSTHKVCIECGSRDTRPATSTPPKPVYVDKNEGLHRHDKNGDRHQNNREGHVREQ